MAADNTNPHIRRPNYSLKTIRYSPFHQLLTTDY